MSDRIFATHVGSLVRPAELLDLAAARERGEPVDAAAHEEAVARAVADVVRRQADAGIDVVDAGEMGESSWITYLDERVGVVTAKPAALAEGARLATRKLFGVNAVAR